MCRSHLFHMALRALAVTVLLLSFSVGHVQKYDKTKKFWIGRHGNLNVKDVTWEYFVHAWARSKNNPPDFCVKPLGQDPGFERFGYDWQRKHALDRNVYNGQLPGHEGRPVTKGRENIPNEGYFNTQDCIVQSLPSKADAHSSVNAPAWVRPPIQGQTRVWGTASGYAFAFSYSSVTYQYSGFLPGDFGVEGKVFTSGEVSGAIGHLGSWVKTRGPLLLWLVENTTGELLFDDVLFDDLLEITGEGSAAWADNRFSISAQEALFSIDMTSPLLRPDLRGSLLLEISGGTIVNSEDHGIFDGLLPSIGSPGSFSIDLPNEYDFHLDLSEYAGRDATLGIECPVNGGTFVPEPCGLTASAAGLLGILTLRRRYAVVRKAPR